MLRLRAAGLRLQLGATVERVEASSIRLKTRDGAVDIPRDPFLVAAIGPAPVRDLAVTLTDMDVPFTLVGDASKPGDFLGAVRDGWMAGLTV